MSIPRWIPVTIGIILFLLMLGLLGRLVPQLVQSFLAIGS